MVASHGETVARLQHGAVLDRFASRLPGGSAATRGGDAYSIVECVYHEHDRTYYALDLLCWAGHALYDCTTEFRWCARLGAAAQVEDNSSKAAPFAAGQSSGKMMWRPRNATVSPGRRPRET